MVYKQKYDKMAEKDKLAESVRRFAKYGTEEYHKYNGSAKSVLPLVVRYKDCTFVGTRHLRRIEDERTRRLVRDAIEKAVLEYFKRTPKDKRFIMVEGSSHGDLISKDGKINMPFKDLDSAMEHGENMGVLFLAKEYDVRASSPEPTDKECIKSLRLKGFTKEEILLFYVARQLPYFEQSNINESLPHFVATIAKDANYIKKEPTRDQITDIIQGLNSSFEKLYGKPMIITENGVMHSNLTIDEASKLISPSLVATDPNKAKLLNYINFELDVRDKKIIEQVTKATDSRLEPFIIYGRSHIAVIKPALDYLYGEPIDVKL